MSEPTTNLPFDPIPVSGPTALTEPLPPRPSFSRSSPEMPTGGLLPPVRKPVTMPPAIQPPPSQLPIGIAPEPPPEVAPNPIAGTPPPNPSAIRSFIRDVVRPTRSKMAVAAGLVSLFAGAYGLNLVMPMPKVGEAKPTKLAAVGGEHENGPSPRIEVETLSPRPVLERNGDTVLASEASPPAAPAPLPPGFAAGSHSDPASAGREPPAGLPPVEALPKAGDTPDRGTQLAWKDDSVRPASAVRVIPESEPPSPSATSTTAPPPIPTSEKPAPLPAPAGLPPLPEAGGTASPVSLPKTEFAPVAPPTAELPKLPAPPPESGPVGTLPQSGPVPGVPEAKPVGATEPLVRPVGREGPPGDVTPVPLPGLPDGTGEKFGDSKPLTATLPPPSPSTGVAGAPPPELPPVGTLPTSSDIPNPTRTVQELPPAPKTEVPTTAAVTAPGLVELPGVKPTQADPENRGATELVLPAAPVTQTGSATESPSKTASLPPPKTDFDVDLVRVRESDTYASISETFYGTKQYAGALRAFNRGAVIGQVREVRVPPMHIIRKQQPGADLSGNERVVPTSGVRGPVLDAPVQPGPEPLDWGAPGTRRPSIRYERYTTPREGMTAREVAKAVYDDERQWGKLSGPQGVRFRPDTLLPLGTEVTVPREVLPWR